MRWTVAIATWACTPPDTGEVPLDDVPPGTPPDTGSPPTPGPPQLSAACVRDPGGNVLRFRCAVTVDPPQPVEVQFGPADGSIPDRVHRSDVVSATHDVPLYFMRPDTDYVFVADAPDDPSVVEVSGTVRTGTVPEAAAVAITSEGSTTSPLVGFVSPCIQGAAVVIADPATATVMWYHDFAEDGGLGWIDAASFTEDHTVLVLVSGAIREVTLTGDPGLTVDPVLHPLHHDLFRKNGLTYALFQELVDVGTQSHLLDGYYVFDATGAVVGEWHLADHFVPSDDVGGGPGAFPVDTSHANAIWVGDDDVVLVSLRHLSAVVAVGGTTHPDVGNVLWRMSGVGGELGSDFVLTTVTTGPATFEQQHNVHLLPDGRMTMFDNRVLLHERSRVIDVSFDPAAGTATIEQEYVLPDHCDYQGAAWRTPAGFPVGTCAPYRDGYEFDPDAPEVWTGVVGAACLDVISVHVPRFVPVDW